MLGVPVAFYGCLKLGYPGVATALPTGLAYLPLTDGVTAGWVLAVAGYCGLTVAPHPLRPGPV